MDPEDNNEIQILLVRKANSQTHGWIWVSTDYRKIAIIRWLVLEYLTMRWEVIMMTSSKAFYDFVLFEKITGPNNI